MTKTTTLPSTLDPVWLKKPFPEKDTNVLDFIRSFAQKHAPGLSNQWQMVLDMSRCLCYWKEPVATSDDFDVFAKAFVEWMALPTQDRTHWEILECRAPSLRTYFVEDKLSCMNFIFPDGEY